jgi:ribA/ribD-fused uncharacterized protein
MDKYTFFWKDKDIYSQWHPVGFEIEGVYFKTAEHYMMYRKAELFKDTKSMEEVLESNHPSDAKSIGRKVFGFNNKRWREFAQNAVYKGNYAKFTQNKNLRDGLLKTEGTKLVEASPYDKIWGIGLNEEDAKKVGEENWKGTNWLGVVLDQVRKDIIEDSYSEKRFLYQIKDHD